MNQELYDQLLNAASVMVGISKFDEAIKKQRQIQDECARTLYDMEKQSKTIGKVLKTLIIIAGVLSGISFCVYLPLGLIGLLTIFGIFFSILIMGPFWVLLSITAIIVVIRILVVKSLKKEYAAKKEECDCIYNKAQEAITELLKKLEEYGEETKSYVEFLPEAYRNPQAIGFMMESVKNFRADNLKEVINLYEHELHMREQERILNNIAAIQEEQNRNMMYAMNEITQNQTRISSTLRNIQDIQIIDFLSRY